MKMVTKFNEKMVAGYMFIKAMLIQILGKLKEENGADGTTEKGGWIVAALILVGLAIVFINTFFPMFFENIGKKLMEMFNIIKFK
ncbi:hypothetical protein [[Clostridium] colinum]|uniref:hypothetical protein n=1 Tax=[Clostridium] colinum TaxID=36835 RepID=UPI00202430EB|nr:hypothetical protein [[Clostridium] colinum]